VGGRTDRRGLCMADRIPVLVTGITGMLGSNIARALLEDPCKDVYGLVRWRSHMGNLAGLLDSLELVYGDVTDDYRMREVIGNIKPRYIYHFAAQAINSVSFASPKVTLDVNVHGCLSLVEAIRSAGLEKKCRIIFAGSSTAYGRTADTWEGKIPETAPLQPVSPYGVSKVSGEFLLKQYFYSHGIEVIIARFFIHVAPGGTDNLALQAFSRQVAMIEAGLVPPVLKHGNLATLRDTTDIRDSAPVVVKLGEIGVPGEVYNVGTGHAWAMRDLLDAVLAQSNVKITLEQDPSKLRVYDEKVLLADNSKLRELTGWVPNPNMNGTIAAILNYWRQEVQLRYPPRSA